MAPKRHQGETGAGSSSRAYDKKKFVSSEAADKFHNVLAGRNLIPERGLRPDYNDGDMESMIYKRGWETFTDQPDPAVTSIVKEFYANAQDTPECSVFVRGKAVEFSSAAINAYYNLTAFNPCPYAALNPDYDRIIRELCRPGTEWKRSTHDGEVRSFSCNRLSRYGKIWYAFLCAKLMPCTHLSNVRKERTGLLYALITDIDIDVGRVIEASIKRSLKGATTSGLPHPSLITGLCQQSGVTWRSAELFQPPLTLLDHSLIQRYDVWHGGLSHPKGLGFIINPQAAAEPAAPPTAPAPTTEASSADPSAQYLGRHFRRLERWMQTLDAQNQCLALRQGEIHQSNVRFHLALTSYFQRLHPNVDIGTFPIPRGLSEFPPPEYSTDADACDASADDNEDNADAPDD